MNGAIVSFIIIVWAIGIKTAVIDDFSATSQLMKCLKEGKINFNGSTECYPLRIQGPCQKDEMLVIAKLDNSSIGSGCKKTLCKQDEFFWAPENKCLITDNELRLCGPFASLKRNVYGDVECSCKSPYVQLSGAGNVSCVKLYEQGPCEEGSMIGFLSEDSITASCMPNPCKQYKMNNTSTWALYKGKCYEIGEQGPCEEPFYIFVVFESYSLGCEDTWNRIPGTGYCLQGGDGSCFIERELTFIHNFAEKRRSIRVVPPDNIASKPQFHRVHMLFLLLYIITEIR